MSGVDPYAVLGVSADVSDAELRRVYRALVKRHHPDHNGGSKESAARFAQVQAAYTAILQMRSGQGAKVKPRAAGQAKPAAAAAAKAQAPPAPAGPDSPAQPGESPVERRIREMEQEIAQVREQDAARRTKEAALQAAARQKAAYEAVAAAAGRRPTPQELGYYSTEDSFSMIVDDATEALGERLRSSEVKRQFARRLTDLFSDGD